MKIETGTLGFDVNTQLGAPGNVLSFTTGVLKYRGGASLSLDRAVNVSGIAGFEITNPSASLILNLASASITGAGTIEKTGPGSMTMPLPAINTSLNSNLRVHGISVREGTLTITTPGAISGTANNATLVQDHAWGVFGSGQLYIQGGVNIAVNAASVTLSGATPQFSQFTAGSIRSNLTTGSITLEQGASLSASDSQGFTNQGVVTIGSGCTLNAGPGMNNLGILRGNGILNSNGTVDQNGLDSDIGAIRGNAVLNVHSGKRLRLTGDVSLASHVTGVSVANGGILDIGESPLLIDYFGVSPISSIEAMVLNNAIISSDAEPGYGIGIVDGTSRVFSGVVFDSSTILVQRARLGDANLDQTVDFADLLTLAQSYGTSNAYWANGDFNYDHVVNFDDLLALAQNYGLSALSLTNSGLFDPLFVNEWASMQAATPEPTMIVPLVAASFMLRRMSRNVC